MTFRNILCRLSDSCSLRVISYFLQFFHASLVVEYALLEKRQASLLKKYSFFLISTVDIFTLELIIY